MKSIFLFIIMFLTTLSALAHETGREIQLKAANDELTKRVAELLDENVKLKAYTAKVQKQIREAPTGKPAVIATGCITPNYEDFFDNFIIKYEQLYRDDLVAEILETNGRNCTREDLDFIERRLIPEMWGGASNMSRIEELMRFYRSKL